jgi:hypothetical protein
MEAAQAAGTAGSGVKYNEPEDWPEWANALRATATSANIWQYIDPGTAVEMPAEPVRPRLNSGLYTKKAPYPPNISLVLLARYAAAPELEPSEEGVAGSPVELTKIGKALWDYHQAEYKADLAEYTPIRAASAQLTTWIQNTVSFDYRKSIKDLTSLREIYGSLKAHYTLYETAIYKKARGAYNTHISQASKWDKKMAEWTTTWKSIMDEGERHGLPEVAEARSWFGDLMEALIRSGTGKSVVDGYLFSVQPAVYAGTISYKDVAVTLAARFATEKQITRPLKAAFSTFQGNGDEGGDKAKGGDSAASTSNRENGRGRGRGRGHGSGGRGRGSSHSGGGPPQQDREYSRGRSPSTRASASRERDSSAEPISRKKARMEGRKCEACFNHHDLANCWYIFPEKSTRGDWEPSPAVKELVQVNLKHNKAAKARVDALRRQSSEQRGD